jgi:hypothetical protein
MTASLNIVEAMDNPQLFQPSFAGSSWNNWRTVLKAAFALPMTAAEIEFFRSIAGGREPPKRRVKELWIIAGRRSGKDSISSMIVAYVAALFNRHTHLRPGESPLCLALACDRDQSKIILNYTRSYFTDIPALQKLVRRETAAGLRLHNSVEIAIGTNSFRSVRGRPILCVVLDECAFYRDESSALADEATYTALVPGMLTMQPDAMLIGISTPYRKAGLLYRKYRESYGKDDDDCLVIQAPTTTLNPTVRQAAIDAEMLKDRADAESEWYARFRDDLSGFISRELLDALVEQGVTVRPPRDNITYFAFVDSSSGSSSDSDSFTMSIAHREVRNGSPLVVIDYVFERLPPFSPSSAVDGAVKILKLYRCSEVTGDCYAKGYVIEAFKTRGFHYRESRWNKSEVYLEFLPLATAGQLLLLDHQKGIAQIAGLVRSPHPGGRDKVDHEKNAHDDVANAICGAAVLASLVREQEAVICGPIAFYKDGSCSDPRLDNQPQTKSTTAALYEYYANGGGNPYDMSPGANWPRIRGG